MALSFHVPLSLVPAERVLGCHGAAAAAAVPVDSNASSNSGDSDWRVYVCDVLHNVAKDHVTETLATVQLHTNINGTDIAYAEYASERRRDAQWAIEGEEG